MQTSTKRRQKTRNEKGGIETEGRLTERERNYINFAFRDMQFPIPVVCGRRKRKREPEGETSDGYGAVAIKPKI